MASGEQLRDLGIERAISVLPTPWKDQYVKLCTNWFRALPTGASFTGEALRSNALKWGLAEPVHPNAWGGVASGFLRGLLNNGDIECIGMAKAKSAKSHAHRYAVYRKL